MLSDPREKFIREQPKRQSAETATETQKKNWSKAGIEWIARLLLIASQKRTDPQEVIAEIAQPPSETLLLEASSPTLNTTLEDDFTTEADNLRTLIGLPKFTQNSLIIERTQAQENFKQKIDQLESATIEHALSTEQIDSSNLRYRELVVTLPVADQARLRFEHLKTSTLLSGKGVKQTEAILDLLAQDSLQVGQLRAIRVDSLRSLNATSRRREIESFVQYSEQILQTVKTPQVIERCKKIGDVPKVLNRLQGLDIRINATLLLTSSGFDTPEDMEALIALGDLPDPDYQNFAEVCRRCPFLFDRLEVGVDPFEVGRNIIHWMISKQTLTSEDMTVFNTVARLYLLTKGSSLAISETDPDAILANQEQILQEEIVTSQLGYELQRRDGSSVGIQIDPIALRQVIRGLHETGELQQLAGLIQQGYIVGTDLANHLVGSSVYHSTDMSTEIEGTKSKIHRTVEGANKVTTKTVFYEQIKALIDPKYVPFSIEFADTKVVVPGQEQFSNRNIEFVFELCRNLATTSRSQQALVGELLGFDPQLGFYARIDNILAQREKLPTSYEPELFRALNKVAVGTSIRERDNQVGQFLIQNRHRLAELTSDWGGVKLDFYREFGSYFSTLADNTTSVESLQNQRLLDPSIVPEDMVDFARFIADYPKAYELLGVNYKEWSQYYDGRFPTAKCYEQMVSSGKGGTAVIREMLTTEVLMAMDVEDQKFWLIWRRLDNTHAQLAKYVFENRERFYDLCEPPNIKSSLLLEYYSQQKQKISESEINNLLNQGCLNGLTNQERAFWLFFSTSHASLAYMDQETHFQLLNDYNLILTKLDPEGDATPGLLVYGASSQLLGFQNMVIQADARSFPSLENEFWFRWKDYPRLVQEYLNTSVTSAGLVSEKVIQDEKTVLQLFNEIKDSPSLALKKVRDQIVPLIMQSPEPMAAFAEIQTLFERNNLPDFAKNFRIFEILYTTKDSKGDSLLKSKISLNSGRVSPVLEQSGERRRVDTLYRDDLRIAIKSNDPSLHSYIELIVEGQGVIDKVIDLGPSALSQQEQSQLEQVLNRLDRLYSNSLLGRMDAKDNASGQEADLAGRIDQLKQDLRVREGQSFSGRIAEMFTLPLGYSSLEEVLDEMSQVKTRAHKRNLYENPVVQEGKIVIQEGDLLKGMTPKALGYVLAGGAVSMEFIGVDAGSDETPFDSDVSYVGTDDTAGGVAGAIECSLAKSYGDLILLLRNRGQYAVTIPGQKVNTRYDKYHYELFKTGIHGERHYGIRTGFPSTEIDAVILKDLLLDEDLLTTLSREQIFFNIANNGFYVPVAKTDGTVIFTDVDYQRFRINQTELQSKLSSEDYQPQELIVELKKSPYIQRLYEMDAGTDESTESHTTKVMQRFEDYIESDFGEKVFTTEEFRLMLALHDIGKPVAVKMTGSTEAQHEYTVQTLRFALQATGLTSRKIESMIAFVNQDALGEYIQGKVTVEQASHELSELAEAMGVPRLDLLETVRQFLICDAGSYEGLKDSFQYSDDGRQVALADEVQEKYNLLVEALK